MKKTSLPGNSVEFVFSSVLVSLPDAACIIDLSGRIINLNDRYASLFGKKVSECHGRSLDDLLENLLASDRILYGKKMREQVVCTRMPVVFEESGPEQIVKVSIAPIRLEKDELDYLMIEIQDITSIKHTNDTLSMSRERFSLAMDLVNAGVWEANLRTGENVWSDNIWQLYGLQKGDKPASTELWRRTIHPDDRDLVMNTVEEAVVHGRKIQIEYRVCHPDSTIRWLVVQGAPLRDSTGELSSYLGVAADITERKIAELEEIKYRHHMDYALEKSHVGIFDLNLADASAKRTAEHDRIFGYEGIAGEWSLEKFLGHVIPEDREKIEQLHRVSMQERQDFSHECRIRRLDGAIRWIAGQAFFFTDRISDEIHVLGIVQDITRRKESEAEMEKLQAQLLQSQKLELLGQIAGGIAHDFNNHLSSILGYAELALEQAGSPLPMHEYLTFIHEAALRSSELTRQLLAFARKQPLKPKVLDLDQEISMLLPMIKRLVDGNIQFEFCSGAQRPIISIDPSQLVQILTNLCINARDAITRSGRITMDTGVHHVGRIGCADENEPCQIPGDYVRLSVTDTGSGIDKETLPHIFEPFFTTKGVGKGTGLGLATVYGIVKQHGGAIDCQSEIGTGTTFTIYFPLHSEQEKEGICRTAPVEQSAASTKQKTILVVDDETGVLNLVRNILEKQGFMVIAAPEGETALETAKRYPGGFDLLITDVRMPKMNGLTLSQLLSADFPRMKTLFISAVTDWKNHINTSFAESANHLSKPFTVKALLEAVHRSLCITLDAQITERPQMQT